MNSLRIARSAPGLGVVLYFTLLVVLLMPTFDKLLYTWQADPSYSHGYFVLPLAIVLGVRRYWRAGPPDLASGDLRRALAAIISGAFFHFGAIVLGWVLLDWVATIFLVRGLLIALGGGSWASSFNMPLIVLFFMFPLPLAWTTYLAIWLQDVVARFSTAVLEPFFLVVRVGKSISIEGVDQPLIVAHECSGVRQLIMFAAMGVFLGEWAMRPWWARLLLLAAALPVSVLANTLRVAMMAAGTVWFGLGWINTGLHDVPAFLGVPLGCLLFLGVHVLIGRLVKNGHAPVAAVESPSVSETRPSALSSLRGRTCWGATVAIACVLGLTVVLKAHLAAKGPETYTTIRSPLATLPEELKIGGQTWIGQTSPAMADLRSRLDFKVDDMLLREFRGPQGGTFTLYAVYSTTAGDRYHHPEHCIRDAAGGSEILAARRRIPLSGNREAQFMRFQVGWGKSTSVYYWHYTFLPPIDRGVTLLQAIHRSIGRIPPSLTFELFADQSDPAFFAALERDVLPQLDAYLYENHLPESAKCGCERFPVVILRY